MNDRDAARSSLAVNGGKPARAQPMPSRHLVGAEERKAVNDLFDDAIRSGNAPGYNGEVEEAYCREFAGFMGGGYADAVSSGTTAVYVALKALDLEPFTEVVVSPVTDPGGMMPIPLLNCIPVVADTMPRSFNSGPEQIEACISPLTSAIVVSHIAGVPADIEGIMELARSRNLPVVEDCAQAHAARVRGRLVGTFGTVGAFSTMFGKHHCTGGQGGVVYTRDEALAQKVRQASDRGKPFGLAPGATNVTASLNFNLNDLAAAIGREQIKKLPGIVERRRTVVAALAKELQGLATVRVPALPQGAEPSYWFWILEAVPESMTCDKETYCRALGAEGLPVGATYNALPHTFTWFTERRVFGTSGYPWASPDYQGDRGRRFPTPNAVDAVARLFILFLTESWGEGEVRDAAAAFRKVDAAFRR
jgi:perosamine synthetase